MWVCARMPRWTVKKKVKIKHASYKHLAANKVKMWRKTETKVIGAYLWSGVGESRRRDNEKWNKAVCMCIYSGRKCGTTVPGGVPWLAWRGGSFDEPGVPEAQVGGWRGRGVIDLYDCTTYLGVYCYNSNQFEFKLSPEIFGISLI